MHFEIEKQLEVHKSLLKIEKKKRNNKKQCSQRISK